jgi:hypothetical protein
MAILGLIKKWSVAELRKCAQSELKKLRATKRTLANGEGLERMISLYQELLDDCNACIEAHTSDENPSGEPEPEVVSNYYERFTSIAQ